MYKFPSLKGKGDVITHVLGLDTEAYTTGEPFMVCMSDGNELEPAQVIPQLLKQYACEHIAVYNLKYDSGAILYHVPQEVLFLLWERNVAQWGDIRLEYIPHKFLGLSQGKKKWVKIWDIAQYYKMSLDKAGQRYLGRGKVDLETKSFTPQYVAKHRKDIKGYCVEDAKLCSELANFLVRKLKEFGIRTTALYSGAALSFRYFADRVPIVTCWRYWKQHPLLLKCATDAYAGGKFEITGRGSVHAWEYDLVSAYPCEIAQLANIELARVVESKSYVPDAYYGFLRCRIRNPKCVHSPCGPMLGPVRVYPSGDFFQCITKAEYEYCIESGCKVDILEGWWLMIPRATFPYHDTVMELFALKSKYKALGDPMLTTVAKVMSNSFYGKAVQAIEDWRGRIVCGPGWNPIYGAVITANTRIKVCRIQNALKDKCLAVHTDSVITTEPLSPELVQNSLGGFAFVDEGPCTIVACGQYCIGHKDAFKGFVPLPGDTWPKVLERNARKMKFRYPVMRVASWVDRVSKGHVDGINVFSNDEKEIDLNADVKRTWLRKVTGKDLLGPVEQSLHRPLVGTVLLIGGKYEQAIHSNTARFSSQCSCRQRTFRRTALRSPLYCTIASLCLCFAISFHC